MHTQDELTSLNDRDYRDAYVDEHVRTTVAYQLRCIREKMGLTQKQFGDLIGKPASVVSRLENTEYGKVTVQTLLDIARRLDVALVVKFASFPTFLEAYRDLSPGSLAVEPYNESQKDRIVTPILAVAVTGVSGQTDVRLPPGAGILSGNSNYYITTVVASGTSAAVLGVAVTPFAILPTCVYRETSHV